MRCLLQLLCHLAYALWRVGCLAHHYLLEFAHRQLHIPLRGNGEFHVAFSEELSTAGANDA